MVGGQVQLLSITTISSNTSTAHHSARKVTSFTFLRWNIGYLIARTIHYRIGADFDAAVTAIGILYMRPILYNKQTRESPAS